MYTLRILVVGLCVPMLFTLKACSNYEPVKASECAKVVKHTQNVLGDLSPTYESLIKSCQASSGDKRGCILAADNFKQMTQCE